MQLTNERRDAVHPGVMTEPVTGHADLAAASPTAGAPSFLAEGAAAQETGDESPLRHGRGTAASAAAVAWMSPEEVNGKTPHQVTKVWVLLTSKRLGLRLIRF